MEEEREAEKQKELGRRVRKEVLYQEQLSERDWLKAIGAEDEEGENSDDYEQGEMARKGKGKKKKNKDYDEEEPRKKKKKGLLSGIIKKMKKLMEVRNFSIILL